MDKENSNESELIAEKIETIEYIFARVAAQTLNDKDQIDLASDIVCRTFDAMGTDQRLLNERTIRAAFKMVSEADSLTVSINTLRNLGKIEGTFWDGKIYNELIYLRATETNGAILEVVNDRLKILRINELDRIAKLANSLPKPQHK